VLVCLVVLAGCGDNAVTPDALPIDTVDAAPDAPTPPPGCSYGELADLTNAIAPEPTNLTFGSSELVLCGAVEPGHANETTLLVDADALGFAIAQQQPVIATLEGTGLEAFSRVELALVDRFGDPIATSAFVGQHAVVAATLPAGSYGVAVRAIGTEPATAVAYTVRIAADDPDQRCARLTTPPDFGELGDGGASTGNDVLEVRFTGDPTMRRVLTAAADAPEATGLVLAPAAKARVSGLSGDVDGADEFRDRDTYVLATGAGVTTLTVQLDWSGAGADLDFLVLPADTTTELVGATRVSTVSPERATFAVAPSTSYWLWIGAYDTSTGLPVTYDATICAE